jgi:hypothetical protein
MYRFLSGLVALMVLSGTPAMAQSITKRDIQGFELGQRADQVQALVNSGVMGHCNRVSTILLCQTDPAKYTRFTVTFAPNLNVVEVVEYIFCSVETDAAVLAKIVEAYELQDIPSTHLQSNVHAPVWSTSSMVITFIGGSSLCPSFDPQMGPSRAYVLKIEDPTIMAREAAAAQERAGQKSPPQNSEAKPARAEA